MRKTKRIIALVLALTMVFCFMAMSASAATTEVQPRAATCPQCGNPSYQSIQSGYDTAHYLNYGHTEAIYKCKNMGAYHAHYYVPYINKTRCATCGYSKTEYPSTMLYCPYGG